MHSLNSFRTAFKIRRCLVPASGYYEWRKSDKQPFYFSRSDEHPLAFAGIYEVDPQGHVSCAIITTTPNLEAGVIHDRMPVILRREFGRGGLRRIRPPLTNARRCWFPRPTERWPSGRSPAKLDPCATTTPF